MREELLEVGAIRIDGDTQSRLAIDQEVVREYAEMMQAGAKFPPVEVVHDGADYWLVDGFHRHLACRMIDSKYVKATVILGMHVDAQWQSLGANKTHGLRRTNADKAYAVKKALQLRPHLSDEALAAHVGVHRQTILKYRELVQSSTCIITTSGDGIVKRVCRDGRRMNTSRIGRSRSVHRRINSITKMVAAGDQTSVAVRAQIPVKLSVNPEQGAQALLRRFDACYLRALTSFLLQYLKEETLCH